MTTRKRNDKASNKFYCGLETVLLRMESLAKANKKIDANFLFGGLIASYENFPLRRDRSCVNKQLLFVSTVARKLPLIKNFVYPLCVR